MSVAHKTVQSPGHTQFRIQRFRAEDQNAFMRGICWYRAIRIISIWFSTRPSGDGVLKFVENSDVQTVTGAGFHQQRSESVLAVIFVAKPQNWFFQIRREGYDSLADEGRFPIDRPDFPRRPEPSQLGRGRLIDVASTIRVALKEACRDCFALRTFDRSAENRSLRLTPREKGELPRLQNCANPHRYRVTRHVRLTSKIPCRITPGKSIQRHQTRTRIGSRARFIKTDVPGPPDAKNLNIEPPGFLDLSFVILTIGIDFRARNQTVRHVNILRWNVHVLKELDLHKVAVALRMIRRQSVVFVEVEGHNGLERESFLPMHSNQLTVELDRCRPGSQPEYRVAPLSASVLYKARE